MKIKICFILILLTITGASAQSTPVGTVSFRKIVEDKFRKTNVTDFARICPIDSDRFARTIFAEYGAIFIAEGVLLPPKCIFDNESDVTSFHAQVKSRTESIAGVPITLQESAMKSLLDARKAALQKGLNITPLDGSIAGKRNFADTARIWNSRYQPALRYWINKGKITQEEADQLVLASISKSVSKVLEWEARGLFFGPNLKSSIVNSAAPPGTSQHNSMLAFDVVQHSNIEIRWILAKHGWFQTILNDHPHFTYLGIAERELPNRGLRYTMIDGRGWWLPITSNTE